MAYRPPVAKAAVSLPRSATPATVSASALAQHLDCRFIAREMIAATVVDPAGLCANDQRRGLLRINSQPFCVPSA